MDVITSDEQAFYSRHLLLAEFGARGQAALKRSSVLVVGAGGLGNPALLYLAAAGFGRIGIVDADTVDQSNLHRQILFDVTKCGQKKVSVAKDRLSLLNPFVSVEVYDTAFSESNGVELVSGYDIVLDGTDNFVAKFLINDACWFAKRPLIYGSIFQFEGQVSIFNARCQDDSIGPNYRDLFPSPPPPELAPSCAEAGVLGVLPGIVGCLQANEAIKLASGIGRPLVGRLLTFNALEGQIREFRLGRRPDNPLSGLSPRITSLTKVTQACAVSGPPVDQISPAELVSLADHGKRLALVDVREVHERALQSLGGEHLRLQSLEDGRMPCVDGMDVVVVYCQSGVRSQRAVRTLRSRHPSLPFLSLEGGIAAFIKSGYRASDIRPVRNT